MRRLAAYERRQEDGSLRKPIGNPKGTFSKEELVKHVENKHAITTNLGVVMAEFVDGEAQKVNHP
jgi:hypothetical protein